MYLLYLDASGVPEDRNCSTYVLLGLCVHESAWHDLEAKVAAIRERHELPGLAMEFHAKDLCGWIREQDRIPHFAELSPQARHDAMKAARAAADPEKQRKRRATLAVAHLTGQERHTLFAELLDLVGANDDVRLFAEAVNKQAAEDSRRLVRDAFAQIVSRFDAYLQFRARGVGERRRAIDRGMLIFDHEPTYHEMLHREFVQYRVSGHPWGRVEHVIEQPFFVDSASVSAVQLADVCAYAVRRHIENPTNQHQMANFNRIFHKFDRAAAKLHGIRHYCKPGSCECRVCQERGHHGG